ncbi:hypothetical protein [Paraburkholderia fungorum]|jgi:hypothetical protein|uniref:Uncharacterized protein n=1 Tax=Paraburkholderia fungorum TaxID=134537 RepID=A0AAP1L5C2_9BURK|nr:hypothetical protein [Paraburkholderia fungorum]KFX66654.1 hypothetical protein KBK24_0100090 [Burkholderia sp. K24]MBB4519496.1 hypothetical protein [Paraburkholderia fungorum]MBB6207329.1 hypothetical protein [Paraburkholderia fungorum]MBU7442350.1 hypothetical protein [Paraburkholderia fungorum]MDT8837426.1 hypothetical protein [Paraburkholderia fungorum]
MSFQHIDKEIAHLERVFGLISANDRIPLSYWRQRLLMLPRTSLMPAQRARLARLEAVLQSLEQSVPTLVAKPPLRPTGT